MVWKQVLEALAPFKMLANADRFALERYARMFVRWKRAEEFIAQYGEKYPIKATNEAGETYIKCFVQFPEVAIAHRLSAALLKIEQEFGMTPSARSRITVPEQKSKEDNGKLRFFAG